MDKYQEFALKRIGYAVYKEQNCSYDSRVAKKDSWDYAAEGKISIEQDENYHITKYFIKFQPNVSKVVINGQCYEKVKDCGSSLPCVVAEVDFDSKAKSIQIECGPLVDPIEVTLEYIDANKEQYDEKIRKENEDTLIQKACIKVSTGVDLVNIYFQPCCGEYERASIELYLAEGRFSTCDWRGNQAGFVPQLLGGTVKQLMGKFKVEEGMMFKSIPGLAKGVYGYRLSQYNEKGECLFTTDYAYFQIK